MRQRKRAQAGGEPLRKVQGPKALTSRPVALWSAAVERPGQPAAAEVPKPSPAAFWAPAAAAARQALPGGGVPPPLQRATWRPPFPPKPSPPATAAAAAATVPKQSGPPGLPRGDRNRAAAATGLPAAVARRGFKTDGGAVTNRRKSEPRLRSAAGLGPLGLSAPRPALPSGLPRPRPASAAHARLGALDAAGRSTPDANGGGNESLSELPASWSQGLDSLFGDRRGPSPGPAGTSGVLKNPRDVFIPLASGDPGAPLLAQPPPPAAPEVVGVRNEVRCPKPAGPRRVHWAPETSPSIETPDAKQKGVFSPMAEALGLPRAGSPMLERAASGGKDSFHPLGTRSGPGAVNSVRP